jgi:serine kinase of HPr protein (carbohydrate metabolism regulator)
MRARSLSIQHLLVGSEARLGLRRVICEKGLTKHLHGIHVQRCVYGSCGGSSGYRGIQAIVFVKRCEGAPPTFPERFRSTNISCIFISEGDAVSKGLRHFAEESGIPLLTSIHETFLLESRLKGLLREKISQQNLVHGVLLKMFGRGVLIQGDSGTGKTSAGVFLVKRGHTWIADDAIRIIKKGGQRLSARGCESTRELIDLKASGLHKAPILLAGCRLARETDLHLILEMEPTCKDPSRRKSQRGLGVREIMGIKVPCIRIPSLQGDDFDLLKVEGRVKAYLAGGGAS